MIVVARPQDVFEVAQLAGNYLAAFKEEKTVPRSERDAILTYFCRSTALAQSALVNQPAQIEVTKPTPEWCDARWEYSVGYSDSSNPLRHIGNIVIYGDVPPIATFKKGIEYDGKVLMDRLIADLVTLNSVSEG